MTTADKIIEALEQLAKEAKKDFDVCGEKYDLFYASGVIAALNTTKSVKEGF